MTWKKVTGFPYEVSDAGQVRHVVRRKVLSPMRTGTKRIGSQRSKVRFSTHPRIDRDVAHLVLEAFVSPRPDGYVAMHRDDDSTNNAATNPRWGTPSDNARDCARKGRSGGQVLSLQDKQDILSYRQQGVRNVVIAKFFGVSQQRTCDVWKGRAVVA